MPDLEQTATKAKYQNRNLLPKFPRPEQAAERTAKSNEVQVCIQREIAGLVERTQTPVVVEF